MVLFTSDPGSLIRNGEKKEIWRTDLVGWAQRVGKTLSEKEKTLLRLRDAIAEDNEAEEDAALWDTEVSRILGSDQGLGGLGTTQLKNLLLLKQKLRGGGRQVLDWLEKAVDTKVADLGGSAEVSTTRERSKKSGTHKHLTVQQFATLVKSVKLKSDSLTTALPHHDAPSSPPPGVPLMPVIPLFGVDIPRAHDQQHAVRQFLDEILRNTGNSTFNIWPPKRPLEPNDLMSVWTISNDSMSECSRLPKIPLRTATSQSELDMWPLEDYKSLWAAIRPKRALSIHISVCKSMISVISRYTPAWLKETCECRATAETAVVDETMSESGRLESLW